MRITSYTQILRGIAARTGTAYNELMTGDVELWHDFIASRYREAYEYYWFPELMDTKEVYVTENTISKDLGIIKAVYKNDPRVDTDQQPLDANPNASGYILDDRHTQEFVWVVYKPHCPNWGSELTNADGETRYYPYDVVLNNDYLFEVKASQTTGTTEIPTITNGRPVDNDYFRYVRLPVFMTNYLKTAVAADLQSQAGEFENYAFLENRARSILDDEVARITLQQQTSSRYNTYK